MAHSDKNILITPNIGSTTADPTIVFSGADATTGAQNITLNVYPENSGTISFEGSAGQLFSITNELTGTIFSVNDVSGIPSIEVIDTGEVRLAQYGGDVILGGDDASNSLSGKLQVTGTAQFSSTVTAPTFVGALTGNATSATSATSAASAAKWTTARTLTLSGAITGSVSIDGSGNVTLATTATSDPTLTLAGDATGSATFTNLGNATLTVAVGDDSHNHSIDTISDEHRLFNNMGDNHSTQTDFNSVSNFGARFIQGSTNGPGTGSSQFYGFTLGLGNEYALSQYALQLAIPRTISTDKYLSFRAREAGTWSAWSKINAGQADTLTTARTINGTSFNGSADITTANWGTARTITLGGDLTGSVSINGSANVTLTAAVVDDSHEHKRLANQSDPSVAPDYALEYLNLQGTTTDTPTTDWYNVIRMGHGDPNTYYNNTLAMKMTGSGTGGLWGRTRTNGTAGSWFRYFDDNYHPNADTWTTARTITLAGDLTGSVSINGSADVTLTAAVVDDSHTHDGRYFTETESDGRYLRSAAASTLSNIMTVGPTGNIIYSEGSGATSGVYIPRPQNASFKTTTANFTGAIAINLPTTGQGKSEMMSFWVDIFDYAGGTEGETVSIFIYGYSYGAGLWTNTGALVLSDKTDRDYTVRFCDSGTQPIVTIGEVTSTWNYLQINVRDFQAGYTVNPADWDDGWSISVITTLPTVRATSTDNYPVAKRWKTARTITLSGAVTGSTTMDGSGNVTITTTATSDPTLTLAGDATGSATFTNLGNATLTVAVVDDSHTHDGRYFTETESDARFWRVNNGTLNVTTTVDGSASNPFDDAHVETRVTGSGSYLLSYTGASAHMISSNVGGSASIFQIGAHYNGNEFWMRTRTDSATWQPWRKLFHENYHPNADTWTTARSISIGGTSKSVNGSANVTWAASEISAQTAVNYNGVAQGTFTPSLRSNVNISGGGTITVNASGSVLWSQRFIVMSNGNGAAFSTNGYFDINCPTSGTITGVGGAANVTATAAGIPLAAWQAIYYILPIGSASTSVAANFRVASYTAALDVPYNWVLVCVRNGDNGQIYFSSGYTLALNQSIATATYNARRSNFADSLTTARTINGTNFNGTAAITTANWGTARTIWGNSINGSVNITAPVQPAAGTAAAPAFSTSGDTNTGIYFPAADQVALSTNSAARLTVSTTAVTSTLPVTVPSAAVTTGAATGINLSATGSGYLFGTTGDGASSTLANVKLASWFGIGFAASISGQTVPQWENAAWINVRNGAFACRNDVTAYSSDQRLKTNFKNIENPIEKLNKIGGYEFDWDFEKCVSLGFEPNRIHEHGVKAQEILEVVPDAVTIAPFDDDGYKQSKSGENYLTVKYDRIVPLLIEAIKALDKKYQTDIEALREEIKNLKK